MTHLDNETLALAQNAVDDLACMISAAGYREAVRDLIRAAPSLLAEVVRLRATIEAARAEVPDLKDWLREFGASEVGIRHSFAVLDAALGPAGADRHNCAQLRATLDAVAEALAGDDQAVLRVAEAQQVLIDADRQEQP